MQTVRYPSQQTKEYNDSDRPLDIEKLQFPQDIAGIIGLRKERINWMKRKGCPFLGRKTCVRWVREFIAMEAGAPCSSH
jgi:hypothetical protein